MGPAGAFCFKMVSEAEREVPKPQWDQERVGMLCTSGENFSEFKGALLKLCKETKLCKYEEVEKKVDGFEKKISRLKARRNLP